MVRPFLKVTQAIQRKEKEIAAIAAKMEDEQTLGGKMHKQVKELSVSKEVGWQLVLMDKKENSATAMHVWIRFDHFILSLKRSSLLVSDSQCSAILSIRNVLPRGNTVSQKGNGLSASRQNRDVARSL